MNWPEVGPPAKTAASMGARPTRRGAGSVEDEQPVPRLPARVVLRTQASHLFDIVSIHPHVVPDAAEAAVFRGTKVLYTSDFSGKHRNEH